MSLENLMFFTSSGVRRIGVGWEKAGRRQLSEHETEKQCALNTM